MSPDNSNNAGAPSGSASRNQNSSRQRGGELIVGRLVSHGSASYQYRSEEGPSYFVNLLTSQGPRTLWGKDLERALREAESRPQAGDLVGARRQAREAVTLTQRTRNTQGTVIATSERIAHRSVWVVEKVTYFAERSRLAKWVREDQTYDKATIKQHPELRSSFLSVRAAEEFARARIVDPEDRQRFLELIRGALSTSIHEGAPLPNIKLRDRTPNAKVPSLPNKPEGPTR